MANLPVHYNFDELIAFPSSNAVDKGVQHIEENTQNTVLRITELNYTLTMNDLVPRYLSNEVIVYANYDIKENKETDLPGKANINGYDIYVEPKTKISIGLPQPDEISLEGPDEERPGYAYLVLQLIFDQNDNLRGDDFVAGAKKMMGVQLCYYTGDQYRKRKKTCLLLGWSNLDGSSIIDNEDKVSRIDPDTIVLKLDGDPIKSPWNEPFPSYPPRQSAKLNTEYINNLMKGYYISKGGDNIYDDITFRIKPDNYDDPKFNWKEQDRLSNDFAIKLVKNSNNDGAIIVKTYEDMDSSFTSMLTQDKLRFYQGKYKGTEVDNEESDADIIFSNDLDDTIFSSKRLLKLVSNKGAIRLAQKTEEESEDKTPLFGFESLLKSHNGVEKGNVVWATNNTGGIKDEDTETRYKGNINYLINEKGYIKTEYETQSASESSSISLACDESKTQIEIISDNENSLPPSILFSNSSEESLVQLGEQKSDEFKNILEISDNLVVKKDTAQSSGGNIQAQGFIYSGTEEDPSKVKVPNDVIAEGTTRFLQSGDIYGTQVWSAVYNDLAEMFEVEETEKFKAGDVIACSLDTDKYTKVNKDNRKSVVGIVSENPGMILGGNDSSKKYVPVALAGRVWVNLTKKKKAKKGQWVYVTKKGTINTTNFRFNKDVIGKIIETDENDKTTVRVIVTL